MEKPLKLALNLQHLCSKSDTGAFCISLFRSIMTQNFVENCGSDIMFNSSSCPPKCRTQLEDLKSTLGCCINNSYLNRSYSSSVIFNYRLWNWCTVPLPPMDCEDGLMLNTPVTTKDCDINTFVDFQLDSYCSDTGQSYVNALLEDSRCSQINFDNAKFIVNTCSIKDDGEFCAIPGDEFNDKYLSLLESNCDLEISNPSAICRSTCRATLMETKATLDCCINVFNQSNLTSPALSYGLWDSCGVQTPGICESTLRLNGAISTMAIYSMRWISTWVVIAVILSLGMHLIQAL